MGSDDVIWMVHGNEVGYDLMTKWILGYILVVVIRLTNDQQ